MRIEKLEFIVLLVGCGAQKYDVIANQSADWCGDPVWRRRAVFCRKPTYLRIKLCFPAMKRFPETLGDCHASLRTGSQ